LSKENRGRDVETAMEMQGDSRIAENNYEEFIDEGSQSAERTTIKKRIKRNFLAGHCN